MRVNRKVAIAIATGLVVLGGLAVTAAAGMFSYITPVSYTMIGGSSGNIVKLGPSGAGPTGAGGSLVPGTVGSILPGECALIGVGDYIPSAGCSSQLSLPYQLTQTPITSSKGAITYFAVTTTNAAPAQGGDRIVFEVRLCEQGADYCNGNFGGGITNAACSPLPGSKTCSWTGRVPFSQWQPSLGAATSTACPRTGSCHGADPGINDQGLIDIVAQRGCNAGCPNGTYDPGNVSWSVAYIAR